MTTKKINVGAWALVIPSPAKYVFLLVFPLILTFSPWEKGTAWAWTDTGGGDHGGADWTPANGATISGTHTNIGTFTISAGATVYVNAYDGGSIALLPSGRGYADNGTPSGFIEIEAAMVTVDGVLEASEAGYLGGAGASVGVAGSDGQPVSGFGYGGGNGGSGGMYHQVGTPNWYPGGAGGAGATSFFRSTYPFSMGGGGGGGGGGYCAGIGGSGNRGGGLVIIISTVNITISSQGEFRTNGRNGSNGTTSSCSGVTMSGGGGGGGGGGYIYLYSANINFTSGAQITSRGGQGGAGGGGTYSENYGASGVVGNGAVIIKYLLFNAGDPPNFTPPEGYPTESILGIIPPPYFIKRVVPAVPTQLTPTFVDTTSADKLKLDWSDNSSNETSFRLERSTDNMTFNLTNASIAPDTTYYIDTGPLLANTTYWHKIQAYNAEGNSGWVTSSPFATRASVPGEGSTSNIYISSITIAWGAGTPANPTGTTYVVERATSSDFWGTKTTPDESGNYTAMFQNLTPNTTYYFRVKARNHGGVDTTYNTVWSAVTRASPPGSTGLSGTTASSLTASWNAGSPPNPSPDTDYVCEISTLPGFGSLINQATTNGFTYQFNNLIHNSTYYVQVKAVNRAGVSSGYTYLGSALTQESKPSGLTATAVFITSASFSWTGSSGSGGYRVEASTSSDFGTVFRSSTTTPNELGNYVTGLNANVLYYFRVGSLNVDGLASWPLGSISTATLAYQPAPGFITSRGGISVSATWGPSGNPGGTAYILEASINSDFSLINQATTITATNGTVGSLNPNTLYYLRVKARNLSNIDTAYTALGSTTTLTAPPANVQFSGVWYSSAALAWDAMTASGYILDWSVFSDFSAKSSSETTVTNATTLSAPGGLAINTTYYFQVGSRNASGELSYAASLTTATLANAPLAVTAPLTSVGPATVTTNWSNSDGNPAGTSYHVQASTKSDFSLIHREITTPDKSGNYTGLISQTTYYFRVRALNHSGIPTNWLALGSTGTIVTVSVSTQNVAPASAAQNTEVALLKLTLATNGSQVNWTTLQLQELGSSLDSDVEEIRIYRDNPSSPGTFDPVGSAYPDIAVYVPGTRFISGSATVNIGAGEPAITTTARTYFVVLKLTSAAITGREVQVRIPTANSFTFVKTLSPLDAGIWQVQGPLPATSGATTIQDAATTVTLTSFNLAPVSIPKGTSNLAMLKITANANTGTASLTALTLTRLGTANNADVAAIKIFADSDSDGNFDPPGSASPDTQINTGDASGFSGPTELVTLDSAQTITEGITSNFFVIFDIPINATTDNTLGVSIAQASNVTFSGASDSASGSFPLPSSQLLITDVPNTLTATIANYPAPATATQGAKAPMLTFSMSVDTNFARWTGLRVDLNGTELSSDVKEARVYRNTDIIPGFSDGDTLIATATFTLGSAYMTFFSTQTINAGQTYTYYLVYLINPNAIPYTNTLTAKIISNSFLTVSTPNTTKIILPSPPVVSGTLTIQPTLDTITVTPGAPQPAPPSVIQGNNDISMAKLRLSVDANAATFTGLRLDMTGSCVDTDITAIKIWRDVDSSGALNTDGQGDQIISSGLDTFFNNVANVTLSIPQNVPVTPAYQDYFVSFSFSPSASVGVTCGLNLTTTNYVMVAPPDRVADSNFPISVQTTINEYPDTIYIATTSIAPSAADPGTPNVPMLKLVMNTGFSGAPWRSVQFDRTGSATSSDMGLVKLWLDRNVNGSLDAVQDAPVLVSASFPIGSGTLTLNINPNESINLTPKTYFVTADISAGATPNRQFGLLAVNNNYFLTQSPNIISTTTTTGYPAFPFQSGAVTINEPPSEVTAIPISLAPSEIIQDSQNVPFLYLSLRTNNYTAYWTTLKLDRTGFGTDSDVSRIRLYADDGDGSFEPTTQDTLVQTGNVTFTNGQTTLSFPPISITKIDKKFFVTLDISPVAGASNNIGLRLGNSLYLGFQSPDFAGAITFETNQSLIQPTVDTLSVSVEPVPTTLKQGDINKAVAKISLRADSHAVAWKGLLVSRLGSLPGSGVAALTIWRDSGSGTLDDSDTLIGTAQQPFTGESTLTTLTLNAQETIITSSQLYFLAVSVDRVLATAGETLGLALSDSGAYVVTEPDLVNASAWQSDLMIVNDYPDVLTIKPSNLELEGIYQGQEQALAKFDLNLNEDTADLLIFKIKKTGTISDTQITGVRLYLDSNNNSVWDKNTDTPISGPVTLSNGLANFAFSPSFALTSATSTIFLTYAVTSDATVRKTLGCNIPDTTYIVLQGTDSASNVNLPFTGSLIQVKDAKVPTKPKVVVDNVYTNRPDKVHVVWDSSVFSGQIQDAEYAIGTSSTATDVRMWTKIGKNKDMTVADLALEHGKTYYIKIMTKSDSGFYSDSGISVGITVDTMKPTIPESPRINVNEDKVVVNWSNGVAGPSGVVGYRIEERNAKTAVWNVITTTASPSVGLNAKTLKRYNSMNAVGSPAEALAQAGLITGNSYFVGSKPSGTYYYRVKAVNGAGTEGDPSPVTRVVVGPAPDAVVSEALCYPNPFDSRRTSANIVYTLNQDTDTEVKIYDIFGRKVWSFTYGQGQEGGRLGTNTVTWDGVDSEGAKVSFGAYICKIEPKAGGESEVKIAVIH